MKENRDFFYWLIIFCCLVLAAAFAQNENMWDLIYIKDATKISWLICFITFFSSLAMGVIAYRKRATQVTMEKLWFFSDAVVTLGMIGTVVGFMIMMSDKFQTVNFNNINSLQDLFKTVGAGIGTITVTTVVGLTSSLILKLQLQFIDHMAVEADEK